MKVYPHRYPRALDLEELTNVPKAGHETQPQKQQHHLCSSVMHVCAVSSRAVALCKTPSSHTAKQALVSFSDAQSKMRKSGMSSAADGVAVGSVSDEQVLLGAVLADHPDVLRAVLEAGNANDWSQWTHPALGSLLHVASSAGSLHCLALLLMTIGDAQVNTYDGAGRTPLFLALLRGHDVVAELLLRDALSIDVNALCGADCETALQLGAEQNKEMLVELMMERGGDPSLTDMSGENAFARAASLNVFRLLCANGHATAALFFGCSAADEALVIVALEVGANVNCRESETGRTCLMVAAVKPNSSPGLISKLIEAGCDVNARNQRGRTALLLAAHKNCIAAAKILASRGADNVAEALEEAQKRGFTQLVAMLQKPTRKKKSQKPIEAIRECLKGVLSDEMLGLLPRKWHLVGDVLLLQAMDGAILALEDAVLSRVGEAYLQCPQIKAASVLMERVSPHGELREPEMQVIAGRKETLTRHTEDGVRYWIDPALVMFSSGNGTERMHFHHNVVLGPGETVVDMFAGIGYFTIPLALSKGPFRPRRIVALEKNPNSVAFLRRNIVENDVSDIVVVEEGDNRQVGQEYVGRATRVLMGYIPTPVQFIGHALSFLSPESGGVIHYHFTSTKQDSASVPLLHILPEIAKTHFRLGAVRVRTVKDYAPQLFHFVADVEVNVE